MLASCLHCLVLIKYVLSDLSVLTYDGKKILGEKLLSYSENKPFVAYWKISYASPPLKELRFKAPVSIRSNFSNINDFSERYEESCASSLDEDCLYLSIFVPQPDNYFDQTLPVLVWLHEHSYNHDTDFFMEENVIVVKISYRTGILGFLNTGDDFAHGNMGAKDVIMALKWIKSNIIIFNGDANRLTICGSDFAANIVASLLVSPTASGLFARVIAQSGSALSTADFKNYEFEVANKLFWRLSGTTEKLNRNALYDLLSTATKRKLASISQLLFDSTEVRDSQRLIHSFGLTVETTKKDPFISKYPVEVYKRKMANNNVEVMMGYSSLESIYKLTGIVKNRKLLHWLNYNFQYLLPFEGKTEEFESKRYRKIRNRIMDFYFVNGTITERSLKRYAKYVSDQVVYPLVRQARLHAGGACKRVYLYRFSMNGPFNVRWLELAPNLSIRGATSGDEICYLFKCKTVNVYNTLKERSEMKFIKSIVRLWANFVKFGNPTPVSSDPFLGDLIWRPLKASTMEVLNLNQTIKMIRAPEAKRVKFWDEFRHDIIKNINHDEL